MFFSLIFDDTYRLLGHVTLCVATGTVFPGFGLEPGAVAFSRVPGKLTVDCSERVGVGGVVPLER